MNRRETRKPAGEKKLKSIGCIPFDPVFTDSMVNGKTIVEYAGKSKTVLAVKQIWDRVLTVISTQLPT